MDGHTLFVTSTVVEFVSKYLDAWKNVRTTLNFKTVACSNTNYPDTVIIYSYSRYTDEQEKTVEPWGYVLSYERLQL